VVNGDEIIVRDGLKTRLRTRPSYVVPTERSEFTINVVSLGFMSCVACIRLFAVLTLLLCLLSGVTQTGLIPVRAGLW
jgi:hypothetical protein